MIVGNALARDLIDLLATHVRDLLQFRHAVNERVASDLCGGIADGGRRCRACAGDRATRAKDDDVGELGRSRLLRRRKRYVCERRQRCT